MILLCLRLQTLFKLGLAAVEPASELDHLIIVLDTLEQIDVEIFALLGFGT